MAYRGNKKGSPCGKPNQFFMLCTKHHRLTNTGKYDDDGYVRCFSFAVQK
jgi:hypothetical protein